MPEIIRFLAEPTWQTIYMVTGSTLFSVILGFPVGVLLCATSPDGLNPKPSLNNVIGRVVNVFRSFPFIILMILLFPLSRLVVGTSIGTTATIVPLSVAAAPFVARIIESALKEVDPGAIQAARVMGSTDAQIIRYVMIPEAMPALVAGITLTIINIIGYSAMAGAIGGGGLGDLAIRYGYQRFRMDVMTGAVLVILIMVELVQFTGTKLADSMIRGR
ncbi:MAG: ABC transporter permease [Deferribacteraceae bacterium]|jgi:D-methionine transport system permease protein|nr:ABC transporter permease [Deferribacteraceae bacterium]